MMYIVGKMKEPIDSNKKKSKKIPKKGKKTSKNEENQGFANIAFPGFEEVMQNNLKIYNNFFNNQTFSTNGKSPSDEKSTNLDQFSVKDWMDLVNPTANKIMQSLHKFTEALQKNPKIYFENINLWQKQIAQLNFYYLARLSNQKADPVIVPEKADKRFAQPEWTENLFFDFIKQFYLITANMLENLLNSVEFIDEKQKALMKFYIRQLNMAFSPTNFVFSNPEVLSTTIKEGGMNLVRGYNNFRDDYLKHPNKLFISQTDFGEFEVGKNLATTAGKVIFKNEVFELIHYNHKTEKQYEVPMVIVPPFINKFYIMDLNEKKSMMNYLLEQNQNVFLISWKNPKSDSRAFGFEEYIEDGVLKAIEVAAQESNAKAVNLSAYCVGGTLTSMTLAHLKNKNFDIKVNSATFFASLINFEEPGDLGIFISDEQIQSIENRMKGQGYFDGKDMAATFNFLRPGDLYWNYVTNNYLLGQKPTAFDMLYWNSDSTRIPEKLHSDYLRSCYLNNKIVKSEYIFKGEKLDLSKVDTPMFHVATTEDHIAPWKSVYVGLKSYSNKSKFVLANSGHIAGIIQGKGAKPGKQYYFENNKTELSKSADEWLNGADKKEGSWWPLWMEWLAEHSGRILDTKLISQNKFKEIYKAPGQYVVEK